MESTGAPTALEKEVGNELPRVCYRAPLQRIAPVTKPLPRRRFGADVAPAVLVARCVRPLRGRLHLRRTDRGEDLG